MCKWIFNHFYDRVLNTIGGNHRSQLADVNALLPYPQCLWMDTFAVFCHLTAIWARDLARSCKSWASVLSRFGGKRYRRYGSHGGHAMLFLIRRIKKLCWPRRRSGILQMTDESQLSFPPPSVCFFSLITYHAS